MAKINVKDVGETRKFLDSYFGLAKSGKVEDLGEVCNEEYERIPKNGSHIYFSKHPDGVNGAVAILHKDGLLILSHGASYEPGVTRNLEIELEKSNLISK